MGLPCMVVYDLVNFNLMCVKDALTEREVAVDWGTCSTALALPTVLTWRGISVRLASSS